MEIQPSCILLGACIAETIILFSNTDRVRGIYRAFERFESIIIVVCQVRLWPIYQGCPSNGD